MRPLHVTVDLLHGWPFGEELGDTLAPGVRDAVVPPQPPVVLGGARGDAARLLQALQQRIERGFREPHTRGHVLHDLIAVGFLARDGREHAGLEEAALHLCLHPHTSFRSILCNTYYMTHSI